jgi:hypothetical protein
MAGAPAPQPGQPAHHAHRGQRTTMTLRFINQQGRELDRAVFARTAGQIQEL